MKIMKKTNIAGAYMPPYTRAWEEEEYQGLKDEIIKIMEHLLHRKNELILVGDFNFREVNWEEGDAGGNMNSWGNVLLDLDTENLLIQNINTLSAGIFLPISAILGLIQALLIDQTSV